MISHAVIFLFFSAVCCSVVEINETTFASLPPLYGLDEWTQCQRPGDVYCIVDAVLLARGPSHSLHFLQEYSIQDLKHYNRTQIHRGVCVSRCVEDGNSTQDWHDAAQRCVNNTITQYGLQAEVVSVDWCSTVGTSPLQSTSATSALAVFCVVIVSLAFLATVLHVIGERCKVDGNKYLLAFSMKRNWDILNYDRSNPRSDERMKNLTAIEGVRVIGVLSVIFSHVLFLFIYSFTDNPQYIEQMYDQFGWQAVLNSPLWLQAFFSISGFLTTYSTLITMDTNPITIFKSLMSILNRYVRLTPVAGFALWFTMAWFPLLGSGPQWSWLVTREAYECSERWWFHMLYVHNHLKMGKLCMGHTWYLAADLQLHIVGVTLLLVLVRFRKAVIPTLTGLIIASSLAAGLVSYFSNLKPIITAQSPETLRTMFAGNETLTKLYLPSWMNLSGYIGGMATAFLLHYTQVNGVKLNRNKWFNILFHGALTLGGCVVLAGTVFLSDSPPPRWASALYASLDRTAVAIFFNIFLLGCFCQCKSGLRSMFEWRGFHVMGRLSYCVYVIHFLVLRLTLAGNTQLGHASIYSFITVFITASVLSFIIAIPCCLLIELPAIELWKAITSNGRSSERPSASPRPQLPPIKPMDLLTHLRRRNEV